MFCLVDAPDAETAERVHRQTHGLAADEIYEVTEHSWPRPGTGKRRSGDTAC